MNPALPLQALRRPQYERDLFDVEVLGDPYPHYRVIRDLGPMVWLPRHGVLAVGRYADVRHVLRSAEDFVSSQGVTLNEPLNAVEEENTLTSDGETHQRLKSVVMAPIVPKAMDDLAVTIAQMADKLIADLVQRDSFDGVSDFARHLPMQVISHLVGLPEEGRERMLQWSDAAFNLSGGFNERGQAAMPVAMEMLQYAATLDRGDLRAGSWGAAIFDAADRGDIEETHVRGLLIDYLAPALDTTLHASAHMIHLLGTHSDQWALLRNDPELVHPAIEEVLRFEAPIRGFTRVADRDTEIGGQPITSGERIWVLNASANRDERHFDEPDVFDVTRRRNDHVSFGSGTHLCAGVHLARLEMRCILHAMIQRVDRIEIGQLAVAENNVLRGWSELPARFFS